MVKCRLWYHKYNMHLYYFYSFLKIKMTLIDELKTPKLSEEEKAVKNYQEEIRNLKEELHVDEDAVDNKVEPLTKEEEAEYLRLNNKYDSLLKKVSWNEDNDKDYRPYDDEEDIFKKQGLSFVTSVDSAWLAIRSKSNNY